MPFVSILFDGTDAGIDIGHEEAPDFFTDLRLDQVVASVVAGREEYRLEPFFHAPLTDLGSIAYRHEVFQDLESPQLLGAVRSFARGMKAMRDLVARSSKTRYRYEKERWFLDAADGYCQAVEELADALGGIQLRSRGFQDFRDFLASYLASGDFAALRADTERLKTDLGAVRYRLHIAGNRITVSHYDGEPDYSADVVRTFEKFRQVQARGYRLDVPSWPDMNHVEAEILTRVARLRPEVFGSLDRFCERHRAYLDETIRRFDREVQFYLAYLEHVERIRSGGLAFCYPVVTDGARDIQGRDVYDLALADQLVRNSALMVANDFQLTPPERVLIVSGPNQGGKTTFARTIGQLHYLASLGCPVPGTEARLFLVDRIFTHFEREEDLRGLTGKLEDELRRVRWILEQATSASLLVMNESFGSTTLDDALLLSTAIMRQVISRDMLCVSVTFLDELASLSEATVSMVSTVDPDDPARRTFKLVRRPADGLAYAAAIAAKHHLTYAGVKGRIPA